MAGWQDKSGKKILRGEGEMHTPKGRDAGSENGGILPRPRNAKNAGK
jgi:hypothetical protein